MQDSVAVVVLDALRADFFKEGFDWLPGQLYEQVYSTSHWTIPAFSSLLTGRMPRETGTYAGSPSFFPPTPSLPVQLRDVGYNTELYTANIQLMQWDGWTEGFKKVVGPDVSENDRLFNWTNAVNDCLLPGPLMYPEIVLRCLLSHSATTESLRDGWERFIGQNGISTNELTQSFLQREPTEQSDFVLFNLMDVHSSMGKSPGEAIASGVSDPDPLVSSYRTAVQGLSASYQILFEHLYQDFDWVITLADHGDLLGEHNLCGHAFGIYPELVQIPLVISSKEKKAAYPTESLVSLLDVTATVRDITGVEQVGSGTSLLDTNVRDTALVERLGQPHLHETMFKRNGIWSDFDDYDVPLRGVAVNDGGYAYETGSDIKTTGPWSGDAAKEIEMAFSDIPMYTCEEGEPSVSENVRERLQELGYA